MPFRTLLVLAGVFSVGWTARLQPSAARPPLPTFRTSDACVACHNGLVTASGEDVSIGSDWRGSMMANSSTDPYWQASVRREVADHPQAAGAIEDTCASCHMPMARALANASDRTGDVFAHLPAGRRTRHEDRLAQEGVSCTMCHQITDRNLGKAESFSGGFVVASVPRPQPPAILGPYHVDAGRSAVMESASDYRASEAPHVRTSELCATCHTLYTQALGPQGQPIGKLPEQTPFLEWRHSAFRDQQGCQSCHMPAVHEQMPIASALGIPRDGFARHVFRGGNFFMLGMLNRYRRDIGVAARPQDLDAAIRQTVQQLQSDTAKISLTVAGVTRDRLDLDVAVENLTGHKLPTGFPSRRSWLHLTVHDRNNRVVFESGALTNEGRIEGNDNDADPRRYEPHFTEIRQGGEVEIYESIIGDRNGDVTTGLLNGTRYLKDNRLLPRGFDKTTAEPDIAVIGAASGDEDFAAGGDRVRYSVDRGGADGPFDVDVELRYQPIGFRWARNLGVYDATETRRFVGYFDSMSSTSSLVLARARTTAR